MCGNLLGMEITLANNNKIKKLIKLSQNMKKKKFCRVSVPITADRKSRRLLKLKKKILR